MLRLRSTSRSLAGRLLLGLALLMGVPAGTSARGTPDRILTVAVLVNAAVPTGYSTDPASPGEFQRYPERYLEHLQVPCEVFDVATAPPPLDLSKRQLILAGHRGLSLPGDWQTAVINAVSGGTGFVNLDWDPAVGSQAHVRTIFQASGSVAGSPGSAISIPAAVRPGGATPHFITALQVVFLGDTVDFAGNLIHNFHPDEQGLGHSVTPTVLQGAAGTVLATVGGDPLVLATGFGGGRAVHFGTLEYLKADRFGFLMGVDDLFWRALVWAARKPFVLRGYPRLWALQMDDTQPGWGSRVRDLFDPALTGPVAPDGTGGP